MEATRVVSRLMVSESRVEPVLVALVESPEWERATRAIEFTARRCGPSWLRDDVVSETRVRLLASVAAGVQIESLCAYAMQVVRSVVRILCAQESPPGVDADSVASAPRPPSDWRRSAKSPDWRCGKHDGR